MHKFDTYIESLTGNLKICDNRKDELAAEFRDHLESLKKEFMLDGLPEDEAEDKAIEIFGNSKNLNKKLHSSLSVYRNIATLLFGALIIVIMFLFQYIPVCGVAIAYQDFGGSNPVKSTYLFFYSSTMHLSSYAIELPYSFFFIFFAFSLILPIAYFSPILINKAVKFRYLLLACTGLGLLLGAFLSMANKYSFSLAILLTCLIGAFIGCVAGYALLLAINNFYIHCKNKNFNKIAGT